MNYTTLSDSDFVQGICQFVKKERLMRKFSQEELARRSGVDRVTISRTEKGRAASILTIIQLLRGLDRLDMLSGFVAQRLQSEFPADTTISNTVVALETQSNQESSYPDW